MASPETNGTSNKGEWTMSTESQSGGLTAAFWRRKYKKGGSNRGVAIQTQLGKHKYYDESEQFTTGHSIQRVGMIIERETAK